MTRLYDRWLFNLLRNCQNVFQSIYTIWHSHLQYMRVPVFHIVTNPQDGQSFNSNYSNGCVEILWFRYLEIIWSFGVLLLRFVSWVHSSTVTSTKFSPHWKQDLSVYYTQCPANEGFPVCWWEWVCQYSFKVVLSL